MNWLATVSRWVRRVYLIPRSLAAVATMFIMFLVTADVFMRDVFNRSILGSYELVEYAMVVTVFCALSVAQVNRFHISVAVAVDRLSRRWRAAFESATLMIMLVLFVAAAWVGYEQTVWVGERHLVSTVLRVARWPVQAVMVAGFAVFCLVIARDLLSAAARALGKDVDIEPKAHEDHSL